MTEIILIILLVLVSVAANHQMKVTKERLVAALQLAKDSKAAADVAKAELDTVNASLASVTAERDALKVDADVLNDPAVEALVDELVPAPAEPVVVPEPAV